MDPVLKELLDEQKVLLEGFVRNPATTFEGYKLQVGLWQGLQTAIDIIARSKEEAD